MKNVAIFYGGKSVEHDISVITALQVMSNFPNKYNLISIYIRPDGSFVTAQNLTDKKIYLDFEKRVQKLFAITFNMGQKSINIVRHNKIKETIKIDCAILCNHGHGGEDGSLQGLLELCEIPYTSSSVAASAISMDKVLTKIMLINSHIDTPAYVQFSMCEYDKNKKEIIDKIRDEISYPIIVKPARLGSSVGINICENEDMLMSAVKNAFLFDDKIIVEKYIKNAREFCVGVINSIGNVFSSKVQEVYKGEFFTFEEKYINKKKIVKQKIPKEFEKKMKDVAEKTYNILECSGVVRIDFLLDEQNGNIFVNEVNSIPGSLAFNLFETKFEDLIITLVEEAVENFEKRQNIQYNFSSTAIEKYINLTQNAKGSKF